MPATYSINDNTVYESLRVANVTDALYLLPDNTFKLISPKDVRDAVFSAWESSVFKQTIGSYSIEYIGLDRDIKQKMFFGKKKLGGLDVLNSTLLNYSFNDTDIFFFNNKPNVTSSNTKISFLAGTNSYLYQLAPYFESYSTTSSTINFDIVNQTGDIVLDSNAGRVSINNVIFPTKLQTASASNGQILKYYNGSLVWSDNTVSLATIGSTSSITNILGSPVLINGNNIELTDSNPIIATFGHIYTGQTFSNAPIVEVVREMLYPYLKPEVSVLVNIGSGFTSSAITEVNSPIFATVSWSITKKSDPIISSGLTNLVSVFPGYTVSTPGLTTISSPPYFQGLTCAPVGTSSVIYTLDVTDSGVSNYILDSGVTSSTPLGPTNVSDFAILNSVYPYFYGVSSVNVPMITGSVSLNSILGSLVKLVDKKSNKIIPLSGTGYIYFMYPVSYDYLGTQSGDTAIRDENGFDISSSFTYSIMTLTSPSSYWSANYIVYKHGPLTVGTPSSVNWQFKY